MKKPWFRLALATVLLAVVVWVVLLTRQQAAFARAERDRLRAELQALTAKVQAANEAARREAVEAARLRTNQIELLSLRGEVARLRKSQMTTPAQPAPAMKVPAAAPSEVENAPASLTVNAHGLLASGHTLVTGGWPWTGGRRGLLLVTPVTRAADDGSARVDITANVALVPDALLEGHGLAALRTGDTETGAGGVLDPAAAASLLQEVMRGLNGAEIVASPEFSTTDGKQARIGITRADLPDMVNLRVTPTLGLEGQIDLDTTIVVVPLPQEVRERLGKVAPPLPEPVP